MTAAAITIALAFLTSAASSDTTTPDVRACVRDGLKWLVEQQKPDGTWVGMNDGYPTFITAFAGLALMMEGSTLTDGKYAPNIRKAVAWFEKNTDANSRIGGKHETEQSSEVFGHAIALLFLVSAYDTDDDTARRTRLGKLIEKALAFAAGCQTESGAWPYRAGPSNSIDPFPTTAMLQALFAARNAGFSVARMQTDRAVLYLIKATKRDGGIGSDGNPNEETSTPMNSLLAASAATGVMMNHGHRPSVLLNWVKSARAGAGPAQKIFTTDPVALFQQFFMARVAFGLGEDRHTALDPGAKGADLVRWFEFRTSIFKSLRETQTKDGCWPDASFGRPLGTSFALIILQLDNGYVPAFAR